MIYSFGRENELMVCPQARLAKRWRAIAVEKGAHYTETFTRSPRFELSTAANTIAKD